MPLREGRARRRDRPGTVPSREEMRAVARTARLAFTADELDRMAVDLRAILDHVDMLEHAIRAAEEQVRVDMPPAAEEAGADVTEPGRREAGADVPESVAGEASADVTEPDAGRSHQRDDVPGADPLSVPPSYFAPEWHDGFFTVPRLPVHRDDG